MSTLYWIVAFVGFFVFAFTVIPAPDATGPVVDRPKPTSTSTPITPQLNNCIGTMAVCK